MNSMDQSAKIVGQVEDPIVAATERVAANAYRSGRRDALTEVEIIIRSASDELLRMARESVTKTSDYVISEGLRGEAMGYRLLLDQIKALPRESA